MQKANTSNLIFRIPVPPVFLKPGDVMESILKGWECCGIAWFDNAGENGAPANQEHVCISRRRAQEGASVGQPSLGDAPRGSHRFGWLANSRGVQFTYFLNTEAK